MTLRQRTTLFYDIPAICTDGVISDLPQFSRKELDEINHYCLTYRELVRGGGTPTTQQDNAFFEFQSVCYAEGVNYAS